MEPNLMPNRILRSWTDSFKFDCISAEAERLFVRLIMVADDYGRYYGDERLISSGCFPLNRNLRTTDVSLWLVELTTRQLILRYEVGGRAYLAILNFRQRLKNSVPKYPPRPGENPDWLPDNRNTPELPGLSGNVPLESESETDSESISPLTPLPGELDESLQKSWLMNEVGAWFNRRASTKWSEKELKSLSSVVRLKPTQEDVALLKTYYTATIPKPRDYRRKDIFTLLNNWNGEMDRARAFDPKEVNGHGLAPIDKAVHSKEYERVCEEIKRIQNMASQDAFGSRTYTQAQATLLKKMRDRKAELMKMLGIVA